MKIFVDEMPETSKNCPFSEWVPNPPFIEEPGYFKCRLTNKYCSLSKTEKECSFFKEFSPYAYGHITF